MYCECFIDVYIRSTQKFVFQKVARADVQINLLIGFLMFTHPEAIAKFMIYLIGFVLFAFGAVQLIALLGTRSVLHLGPGAFVLPAAVTLIGGFLLMLALGTSTLIAVGGAIAMTFCSYNFQIIEAGHNTKMQAIAYFPWVLAGLIFTYKTALQAFKTQEIESSPSWKTWLSKTLLGATLFGFALSMQIKANHPQISYYMAMVIFIFAIGLLIYLSIYKEKRRLLKRFFATSAIVLVV